MKERLLSSNLFLYESVGEVVVKMKNVWKENFWVFMIGMHQYKGEIYGIQYDQNEIMKLDSDGKGVRFIGHVPLESEDVLKMYHKVLVRDKRAYYIPFRQTKICIYDFVTNKYEFIPLKLKENKICGDVGLFCEAVFWKEYLVLIPFAYREVVFVHLQTGEQMTVDIECDFCKESEVHLFWTYTYKDDNTLILPSLSSNKIMEFDMEKKKYRIVRLGNSSDKWGAIVGYKGRNFLFLKNRLGMLELKKDFSVEDTHYFDDIEWDEKERQTFFDPESMALCGDVLYCFPAKWNHAVKIEINNRKANILKCFEPYSNAEELDIDISVIDGSARDGKYIYLNYQLNKILRFDLETEEIKEYERKVYDPDRTRFREFIERVGRGDREKKVPQFKNVGEKIYGGIVID